MVKKHTYKNLIWVDLESPSADEIKMLMQEYAIDPKVGEELLSPTLKPHLDICDDYAYLVLHFPGTPRTQSNQTNQEVDFIISENFLITVRYDVVEPLNRFAKEFEMDTILDESVASKHAGYLFYYLIRFLYHSLSEELEYAEGQLERIEDHIFQGREREMVQAISLVSRNMLDIKHTIEHHETILHELQKALGKMFTDQFSATLSSVIVDYKQTMKYISNLTEFLNELRATNDSLLSTKQNETMKTLTIMAFVVFPLSLIAAIFGMNTKILPIVGHPYDFWIVIGIMVALTALFFWYFKYKKWL